MNQADEDRAALAAKVQKRITDELEALFIDGLNGDRRIRMPHARISMTRGDFIATSKTFSAALYDVLDVPYIFEMLRWVFAESQCPLVADFKVAAAERYAADNAQELALAELENEQ